MTKKPTNIKKIHLSRTKKAIFFLLNVQMCNIVGKKVRKMSDQNKKKHD